MKIFSGVACCAMMIALSFGWIVPAHADSSNPLAYGSDHQLLTKGQCALSPNLLLGFQYRKAKNN
jgi:hypothetical protein